MLNDRVVPFFEEQGIPLLRILTDRGTEYCGNREHHEYQLYLAIENIDHTKTKARSPQTNGICERFHKTCPSGRRAKRVIRRSFSQAAERGGYFLAFEPRARAWSWLVQRQPVRSVASMAEDQVLISAVDRSERRTAARMTSRHSSIS